MGPLAKAGALLALFASASAAAEGEAAAATAEEASLPMSDDECGADGGESCALSALQVRGRAVQGASGQVEAVANESQGAWWETCSRIGCHAPYSRYSTCQCNSKCHQYRNCCADYDAKCAHKGAPSKASCSAVPSCAHLRLGGDCCPTPRGDFLGCCPESMVPHATAPPPRVVNGHSLMTLYHQTSPEICDLIMKNGFKIGHGGWCGNAIYFALSPEATKTKAITPHSGAGCVIEATVEVGKVKKFPCCRYCGGRQDQHVYWTEHQLQAEGFGAIEINPGDGPEIVIYNNKQVKSMRIMPWLESWRPHRLHYKE